MTHWCQIRRETLPLSSIPDFCCDFWIWHGGITTGANFHKSHSNMMEDIG